MYASTAFSAWEPQALMRFANGAAADCMRWVGVLRLDFQFAEPVVVGGVVVPAGAADRGGGVDWDETCRCLRMMTGLRALYVAIYPYDALAERNGASGMVWGMLDGLRGVRAEKFRVRIRKRFIELRDMIGEAPFEVGEAHDFTLSDYDIPR